MPLVKRVVIPAIPAGLFLVFLSSITVQAGIACYMQRAMVNITSWMFSTLAYNLMLGLIFTFVYTQVQSALKGPSPVAKGLIYGFLIWMVSGLPSLVSTVIQNPSFYVVMHVEFLTTFVGYPLMGAIIATLSDRYCK